MAMISQRPSHGHMRLASETGKYVSDVSCDIHVVSVARMRAHTHDSMEAFFKLLNSKLHIQVNSQQNKHQLHKQYYICYYYYYC